MGGGKGEMEGGGEAENKRGMEDQKGEKRGQG